MNYIVPLSTGELLAFAFVCACVGVSMGLGLAWWIASRDPTTDRRGTGHAPTDDNPRIERFREGSERGQIKRLPDPLPPRPAAPPPPPRLTPHERRKYRS